MSKKALGRGLDALISGGINRDAAAANTEAAAVGVLEPPAAQPAEPPASVSPGITTSALGSSVVRHLPIATIDPNRFQPRNDFDPEHLRELAESISQQGIVQPLVVRPATAGTDGGTRRYELIAGERRLRAARLAGLETVPAIVREATDLEALEIALIENLQREDLNPIEEALAYQQLTVAFSLTQEQVAEKVGRSRAAVANAIRLLGLHDDVQAWVADGRLSVGHAKAILGLTIKDEQQLVAQRILKQGLTVRQAEQLIEQLKGIGKRNDGRGTPVALSAQIAAIEDRLKQKLSTQVNIRHGKTKGRIQIEYYGNDDLSRLLTLLGVDDL